MELRQLVRLVRIMNQRLLEEPLRLSFWRQVVVALCFYFGCSGVGILASTDGWAKLMVEPGQTFQHWDSTSYAHLALYPQCQAFYPLWPQVIGAFRPGDLNDGLRLAFGFSTVLFVGTLPLLLWILRRVIRSGWTSFVMLLLYVLNPNSIFHSIGYTESLFSGFALVAITALLFPTNRMWNIGLGLAAIGMGLCRPSVIQIVAAAVFALGCQYWGQYSSQACGGEDSGLRSWKAYFVPMMILAVGSMVGYSIYGVSCLQSTGNFLFPFQAQVTWGRRLNFNSSFLVLPRSLLNDLHGLYFPFILFALTGILTYGAAKGRQVLVYVPKSPWLWLTLFYPPVALVIYGVQYQRLKNLGQLMRYEVSSRMRSVGGRYLFYFCLSMAMANAAIGFLAASESLYSLARFVFGTPWFFVAMGMVADGLESARLRKFLVGCLGVSVLGFIHQWYNWGNHLWLG